MRRKKDFFVISYFNTPSFFISLDEFASIVSLHLFCTSLGNLFEWKYVRLNQKVELELFSSTQSNFLHFMKHPIPIPVPITSLLIFWIILYEPPYFLFLCFLMTKNQQPSVKSVKCVKAALFDKVGHAFLVNK